MGSGVAFKLGPVVIHWYGLLVIAGILVGGAVATIEARRRGEDPERVREGMSGNLCRCAAYAGITEAVLEATRASANAEGRDAA